MTEEPSAFFIHDGVGYINYEPVTDDTAVTDFDAGTMIHRTRVMRFTVGDWALSVVFGSGTYSDNHDTYFMDLGDHEFQEVSHTAEIAVIPPYAGHPTCAVFDWGNGVKTSGLSSIFEDEWGGDTVKGYCTAKEVLYWLERLRAYVRDHAEAAPSNASETS